MTIPEGQPEEGDDALAREAAHWFARMRAPDANASRAEFEAWLAQGPEHRVAYNDAAEIFALGKLLAEPGEQGGEARRIERGQRFAQGGEQRQAIAQGREVAWSCRAQGHPREDALEIADATQGLA